MQKAFPEKAYWKTIQKVELLLSHDCNKPIECPKVLFRGQEITSLNQSAILDFAQKSGYGFFDKLYFFLPVPNLLHYTEKDYYVAGNFNNWKPDQSWKLIFNTEYHCFLLEIPIEKIQKHLGDKVPVFKFVSSRGEWIDPPETANNILQCERGFRNWVLKFEKTGKHVWEFELPNPHSLQETEALQWIDGQQILQSLTISNLPLLLKQASTKPLGVIIENGKTTFQLFAPRARHVGVSFWPINKTTVTSLALSRQNDGIWSLTVPSVLKDYRYHYYVEGENLDETTSFQPKPLLDPYAIATTGPNGPGIIVEAPKPKRAPAYEAPPLQNLVILEAHIRDLVANTAFAKGKKSFGFKELTAWVGSANNYLVDLGINAIELQPVTEFDYTTPEEYQWGYMPVNYFAPSSAYAQNSEEGSQISEFQDLVQAFHQKGIAVILDVVYNHMGHLNSLLHIDKYYYFTSHEDGKLSNWSGCGNDLRVNAPMVERLVIDSLKHWIQLYDIDGFRFDLAELLGLPLLKRVEQELKKIKPSVILIAEPWSFRKHIGHDLKETQFSSWNDGYREFLAQYVWGQGNIEGIQYFLKGSLDYLSSFPAQSINYTESHDDHSWIDKLTEKADKNAFYPTLNDRRRTHLMFATLFMSFGIPMISSGQDFLRSKQGVRNTYNRGDLNALDYSRREIFSGSSEYVKNWVNFRLSSLGKTLRLEQKPKDTFWQFFYTKGTSAVTVLYNADYSQGSSQLLFAINPHTHDIEWTFDKAEMFGFKQIADTERFNVNGLSSPITFLEKNKLRLPALSCALWVNSS